MKQHLIVANPEELGYTNDNIRYAHIGEIPLRVRQMAKEYPGKEIWVYSPRLHYFSKCDVSLTEFTINDKFEEMPT